MTIRDRPVVTRIRLRHPRTTVRWRLAVLYGGLFLASGATLLAITYALVDHATLSGPRINFALVGRLANRRHPVQVKVLGHERGAPAALLPALRELLRSRAGKDVVKFVGDQQRISDLHHLEIESAIALAIMTVISAALGWLIAGRVLRPLRTITTATHQISEHNLHQRLALTGPPDELRQLADTIDGLLQRLESAFTAQRAFVANASHELRTPLSVVRAVLEMILSDPHANTETFRDACQQALEENQHQEQLIDSLLALAQGQRGVEHHEHVDLAAIAAEVAQRAHREAVAHRVQLDTNMALEPAALSGDPRLIERLASNLVDNAIRHNRPGGHVQVSTRTRNDHAILTVTNTGPIVPAEAVGRLLDPFQRLTAERIGQDDGLGLGLSIVAAIAGAHAAELTLDPASSGGLQVQVRFPRQPQPLTASDAVSTNPAPLSVKFTNDLQK